MRGYGYFIALVCLPVLSWIAQALWIVFAPERLIHAPVVAWLVFWLLLTLVWLSSIGFIVLDRKVPLAKPRYALRILETTVISVASVVVVAFSVLSIGISPFLPGEKASEAAEVRIGGKDLPRGEGSVQFRGTLYVRGVVAGNTSLVFLFDGGFVSRPIVTDREGKFTYTLPPGRWILLAPDLPGYPGNVRLEIDPPVPRRTLSFDVSDGPVSQTYKVVVYAE